MHKYNQYPHTYCPSRTCEICVCHSVCFVCLEHERDVHKYLRLQYFHKYFGSKASIPRYTLVSSATEVFFRVVQIPIMSGHHILRGENNEIDWLGGEIKSRGYSKHWDLIGKNLNEMGLPPNMWNHPMVIAVILGWADRLGSASRPPVQKTNKYCLSTYSYIVWVSAARKWRSAMSLASSSPRQCAPARRATSRLCSWLQRIVLGIPGISCMTQERQIGNWKITYPNIWEIGPSNRHSYITYPNIGKIG